VLKVEGPLAVFEQSIICFESTIGPPFLSV